MNSKPVNNVLPFDVSFKAKMTDPVNNIKAEVIRRGWTAFRIEFDTDKDTLMVHRIRSCTNV